MLYILHVLSLLFIVLGDEYADQVLLSSPNQDAALTRFEVALSNELKFSTNALLQAMSRGWWNTTHRLLDEYYNPNGIDIYEELLRFRKRHLNVSNERYFNEMMLHVPAHSPRAQKVEPCFLWAQNRTNMFVKVKFSPRLDMPSPVKLFNITVDHTSNHFNVSAISFESDQIIIWNLFIRTYLNIWVHCCFHWEIMDLNTVYITFRKTPDMFWKNIILKELQTLPNQYFWWDLHQKMIPQLGIDTYHLVDREFDIDKLEDHKEKIEERRLRDIKRKKARLEEDQLRVQEELRNEQKCWDKLYRPKCPVLDSFDWNAWTF